MVPFGIDQAVTAEALRSSIVRFQLGDTSVVIPALSEPISLVLRDERCTGETTGNNIFYYNPDRTKGRVGNVVAHEFDHIRRQRGATKNAHLESEISQETSRISRHANEQ